jgi:hypothetical protein
VRTLVSRGLRVAAAGALVAVWAGVGSGTSGAVIPLVTCDQVAATVLMNDGSGLGIGGTLKNITAAAKGLGRGNGDGVLGGLSGDTPSTLDLLSGDTVNLDIASFKGGASAPCTYNIALNSGNLTKLSGKLTGRVTCDPTSTDPTQYPLNGKLTMTYTADVNPADGKPDSSSAYVRTNQVPGGFADDVLVHGIVTKGVAVGADFDSTAMFHPYQSKTQPFPTELMDAQSACVPGGGPGTVETFLLMTDAYTLGIVNNTDPCFGGLGNPACKLNGNIQLSFP